MVLTRATLVGPGADGILGDNPATTTVNEGADDTNRPVNTTTSFVDQNQTYTSHPSHQVFLREYVLLVDSNSVDIDGDGILDPHPVATGRLIQGSNGGMATWADLKAQARDILGIDLTDCLCRQPATAGDRPLRQLHPGSGHRLPAGRHGRSPNGPGLRHA